MSEITGIFRPDRLLRSRCSSAQTRADDRNDNKWMTSPRLHEEQAAESAKEISSQGFALVEGHKWR